MPDTSATHCQHGPLASDGLPVIGDPCWQEASRRNVPVSQVTSGCTRDECYCSIETMATCPAFSVWPDDSCEMCGSVRRCQHSGGEE
jgi:hypothetical protein